MSVENIWLNANYDGTKGDEGKQSTWARRLDHKTQDITAGTTIYLSFAQQSLLSDVTFHMFRLLSSFSVYFLFSFFSESPGLKRKNEKVTIKNYIYFIQYAHISRWYFNV